MNKSKQKLMNERMARVRSFKKKRKKNLEYKKKSYKKMHGSGGPLAHTIHNLGSASKYGLIASSLGVPLVSGIAGYYAGKKKKGKKKKKKKLIHKYFKKV
jgi:hypothetical protein